jgi:hypothetical protein
MTSPEGAQLKDLCRDGQWCSESDCIRYHPIWMTNVCTKFLIEQNCSFKGCNREHVNWPRLMQRITLDKQIDMFTKRPFEKVQMFRIIPAKSRGAFQGPIGDRTATMMQFEEEPTSF